MLIARGSIHKRTLDSGEVRYDVRIDLGPDPLTGQRRQRSATYRTRREAQQRLVSWLAELHAGDVVDRSPRTVGEVIRYWLDTDARGRTRPTTRELYERTARVHLLPTLGAIPAQQLRPAAIQALYSHILEGGAGPHVVQLCHVVLRGAFGQATRLGLLARNPALQVTAPRITEREMRVWDAEQSRRFLAAAQASPLGPVYAVLLSTGIRRGEVLGLRWSDVDWTRGALRIRQAVHPVRHRAQIGPLKTGRRALRDVPLQPAVAALLRAHQQRQQVRRTELGVHWQDHDLVFPAANGAPFQPSNVRRDYMKWVRSAGVPLIRLHDLRHTFATLWILRGGSLPALSRILGHQTMATTLRTYAHVLPELEREGAAGVGDVLFGIAQDAPVEEL
jgi:integrase